jgi:hypothetical protein
LHKQAPTNTQQQQTQIIEGVADRITVNETQISNRTKEQLKIIDETFKQNKEEINKLTDFFIQEQKNKIEYIKKQLDTASEETNKKIKEHIEDNIKKEFEKQIQDEIKTIMPSLKEKTLNEIRTDKQFIKSEIVLTAAKWLNENPEEIKKTIIKTAILLGSAREDCKVCGKLKTLKGILKDNKLMIKCESCSDISFETEL